MCAAVTLLVAVIGVGLPLQSTTLQRLSLSQLASEKSPLLSVTFGWAGKDQRIAF